MSRISAKPALILLAVAISANGSQALEPHLPQPLVFLRDVEATIFQDIRYAGRNNFTGTQVEGYEAPECILTRATADKLSRVQEDLRRQMLSLKVYDCYRPLRAVASFVRWAQGDRSNHLRSEYHPRVDREHLMREGYIAAVSSHSRGNAVDLTLVNLQPLNQDHLSAARTCNGPSDNSVDMGTSFDCFDPQSRTDSLEISATQAHWRRTLRKIMTRHGFRNYTKEWWHYTYPAGDGGRPFDVVVRSRN